METSGWKTATVANTGTQSAAVDLGKQYRSLAVYVGTIDSGTVTIQTAMTSDGTFQTLYLISTNDADDDAITCSTSTGGINFTVPFFGWQHLKFTVATATAARTIYCCGFN